MAQQNLALSFKALEMMAYLLYTALKTLLDDGGNENNRAKDIFQNPKPIWCDKDIFVTSLTFGFEQGRYEVDYGTPRCMPQVLLEGIFDNPAA